MSVVSDLRIRLCGSANVKFQRIVERDDLMNEYKTQDKLVQCLWYITRVYPVMFTAVKSDHDDDSGLGPHCHFNGFCADLWPIYIAHGNWQYMDATDVNFQKFLERVKSAPFIHEVGLAGSAYTETNMMFFGSGCPEAFQDDGDDHIHIGVM